MSVSAAYLTPGQGREPYHYTPEMSRRARGIDRPWPARATLRDATARRGHTILNDVVTDQVLVSFGAPERTLAVVRRLREEGVCWCGKTEWQGRTAMRISVSSWATTDRDVDLTLEAIVRAAS
jgi:hypothetical protein